MAPPSLELLPGPVVRNRRFSNSPRAGNRIAAMALWLAILLMMLTFAFSAVQISHASSSTKTPKNSSENVADVYSVVPGAPVVVRVAQKLNVNSGTNETSPGNENEMPLSKENSEATEAIYSPPPAVHPETGKVWGRPKI